MKLRVVALHTAFALALWFLGTLVYVAKFVGFSQPLWFAIDSVIVVACFGLVFWRWEELGIRVVTRLQLVAIIAVSTYCAYKVLAIVPDRHWMAMDETQYLATLREGTLRMDGPNAFMPFNMRWLLPILAGPLNIIPADDMAALAALNLGGIVVTAVYLALLLRRIGVRYSLALLSPVFLLSSFLGEFTGIDRLVVDPMNYAFYVLIFHAFLRREHARLLAVLLLIAGFNSEKTLYWIPVLGCAELLRRERPWSLSDIKASAIYMLKVGGPFLAYLALLLFLLRNTTAPDNYSYIQHLHQMSPTWIQVDITKWPVPESRFQLYWFPFGGFTVYTLLALRIAPKWITTVALMLLPIYVQPLFSYDMERMIAYSFVIYLPLGVYFLEHAFRSFPRWLPPVLTVLLVGLAVSQRYLVYLEIIPPVASPSRFVKLVMSSTEILLIATIVYLHLVVFRDDGKAAPSIAGEHEEEHHQADDGRDAEAAIREAAR
ncbi:MAG: hypothetical protein ACKV2T_11230 [Kofleriaceae bacterium]